MHPTSRACISAIALLGLGAASTGCGAVVYTADVISAGSVVAEAEAAGAAELSPYEFYAAREYLTKAREEASEAAYEDAIRFADEAGRLGLLARDQSRSARSIRTSGGDAVETPSAPATTTPTSTAPASTTPASTAPASTPDTSDENERPPGQRGAR